MRIKYLIRVVLFMLLTVPSDAQSTAEELFALKLFHIVQTNNLGDFEKLLITYKEYIDEIVPEMQKDTIHKIPPMFMQEGIDFYKNEKNKILFRRIFENIIIQANSLGIKDWADTKFLKFEIPGITDRKVGNIVNGNIVFSYQKTEYLLFDVVIQKLNSGYKLISIRGIFRSKSA